MMDENKIDEVAHKILESKEILLGGDRYSQIVAQDFQMKLLTLGIYAKTYSDMKLQFDHIQNRRGLFILFSASCTKSKTILELSKKRGWDVVIITRNSKIQEDNVLLYDDIYQSDWTVNSINDRFCMGMLVDQLILKIASCAINKK